MKDFADPLRTLERLPFEVVQGEIDGLLNPMGLPRPPPSACAARYCTQPAAAPSSLATQSSIDPTRSVPTSACWPRITGRGRVVLGRVQRSRHLLSLVGALGERVPTPSRPHVADPGSYCIAKNVECVLTAAGRRPECAVPRQLHGPEAQSVNSIAAK